MVRRDYSSGNYDNVPAASEKLDFDYVPPDGGWGWLVLFGCTLVNFLLPGTIKTFGVFFIEFLETYQLSEVQAAWIPALCYFLYCSLGPLSNYLSSKYSYRTVALIGGTFAVIGLILSSFATTLLQLCLTYGLLFGTGTGLSFPPGIFIVTSYFQKYRGLANGVAASGSAVGSILLPPLLTYLLQNYGLNGAVFIMGAVTMNVWVGALLYHPVSWHLKKQPRQFATQMSTEDMTRDCLYTKPADSSSPLQDNERLDGTQIVAKENVCINENNERDTLPETTDIITSPRISITNENNEETTTLYYSSSNRKVCILKPIRKGGLKGGAYVDYEESPSWPSISSPVVSKYNSCSTLGNLPPLDYASQATLKSISESIAPRRRENGTKESSQLSELMRTPIFITLLISSATTAIGYTNFTIFLPAYAMSLHFDKNSSSYLLSVVAFFDLIGRIGGSSVSDFLSLSKKYYFVIGLLISGVTLMMLPFAQNYTVLCLACSIFGLSSGVSNGVFVVAIVELLGEDKLASSYTVSLFLNGILQLFGPPLCGFIYQQMKSFGAIICTLGITVTSGGLIWTLPFVISWIKRRKKEMKVTANGSTI